MQNHEPTKLEEALKKSGWTNDNPGHEFPRNWAKGRWELWHDTSSSWDLRTARNSLGSIFETTREIPEEASAHWTVKFTELICAIDDERFRLRDALRKIVDTTPPSDPAHALAAQAVQTCYHTQEEATKYYHPLCPICDRPASTPKS
jgi:hypothetical protein